ncbi:NUDIX hydrolase [Geotalea daltonii FRC-32]|uniref:NUDIX hydrolase n=1 Tax=Geotalea daltonii (strain DSM 22248 / JCM 15807 / FRC-32) TaxID=316067 RepID=B9M7L1_GEODF|nr:NUDIX hydrolase [Geotalea daltonii]ACM22117.1 NUDIX hydrolase [Geotalea daltonii FRC-32]
MTEQKQTVVVTCLIRNAAAEILLIRHFRRGWELPQGRVEAGEALTAAVHREVLEETGTLIELGPLAAVWTKICAPPATIFGFTGIYRSGELVPSEETPEVRWFSPNDALGLVTHQVNHDRLQTLLYHSGGVIQRAYQARPFTILGVCRTSGSKRENGADSF